MIQRIQTVYLLLTAILGVLFLTGGILIFTSTTSNDLIVRLTGIYTVGGESGIEKIYTPVLLPAILIIIPVISLITIFLFKNRKLQMKSNLGLIILIMVLILLLLFQIISISSEFHVNFSPGLKLGIPLLMMICSVMSYRAIRKDEDMVKSFDRLR